MGMPENAASLLATCVRARAVKLPFFRILTPRTSPAQMRPRYGRICAHAHIPYAIAPNCLS